MPKDHHRPRSASECATPLKARKTKTSAGQAIFAEPKDSPANRNGMSMDYTGCKAEGGQRGGTGGVGSEGDLPIRTGG